MAKKYVHHNYAVLYSILNHKKSVTTVVLLTIAFFLSYYLDGPHQKVSVVLLVVLFV